MPHRFSASQWWPLVERYRPTWINVVPTIIAYLINGPELTPGQALACRAIRFGRSASAPLPPDQHRAFEARFGISVIEAMGLTESAAIAFTNPLDARRAQVRHARTAAGGRGAGGRARRRRAACRHAGRDRVARRLRDAGLLQGPGDHRPNAAPRRLAARPGTWGTATPTASISSRGVSRSSSSRAARTSRRARSTKRC